MAVQLNISYETLVELIQQLPPAQRQDLLLRLLRKSDDLAFADWEGLFRAAVIQTPVTDQFSFDREDWYDNER